MEKEKKREDFLGWTEYFMGIAYLSGMRSKDPHTQVGAVIVNEDMKIVGIGYNGFPHGCSDDILPWARNGNTLLDTKYPYVCHAELNAIINKNSADTKNCTLYVALFPCNECAKIIIQSGIKKIVYGAEKCPSRPEYEASRRMLTMAQIQLEKFITNRRQIIIDFDAIPDIQLKSVDKGTIISDQLLDLSIQNK